MTGNPRTCGLWRLMLGGMPITRREGEDRILTVPNALTAIRLACLPVFVVLMAQPNGSGRLAAACLLGALGVTDGLDGYVARHFDQVSTLGKMADPLVDRALVLTAVIATVAIGAIPVWLVVVVLAREALVLGGSARAVAGGRQTYRCELGRQGGDLRDDGRPAPVHSGPRSVPLAYRSRVGGLGGGGVGAGARLVRRHRVPP